MHICVTRLQGVYFSVPREEISHFKNSIFRYILMSSIRKISNENACRCVLGDIIGYKTASQIAKTLGSIYVIVIGRHRSEVFALWDLVEVTEFWLIVLISGVGGGYKNGFVLTYVNLSVTIWRFLHICWQALLGDICVVNSLWDFPHQISTFAAFLDKLRIGLSSDLMSELIIRLFRPDNILVTLRLNSWRLLASDWSSSLCAFVDKPLFRFSSNLVGKLIIGFPSPV